MSKEVNCVVCSTALKKIEIKQNTEYCNWCTHEHIIGANSDVNYQMNTNN